tara:strand:+ start:1432 stop:2106 length:675 start_codon:yes stop_codon:yes gene_type:complete
VSYSYYEVYTNAQRAFSGLGFPYGADEDAAYIISWLEAFELDGIHLLSIIKKKIDSNFNGVLGNNKLTNQINLENRSCLMIGPGLIDFLNFHTLKNNGIKIEFQNCSDPLFLIPLLYRAVKKNIFSKIISKNKIYTVLGKNEIFIHDDIKNNKCENFILNLSTNEYQIDNEEALDYNLLNINISNGLNPNQSSWDEISDLAFRTYVPESEESREKGAGGGDAND